MSTKSTEREGKVEVQHLPLDRVHPSPHQNRHFPKKPDQALLDLASSVRRHGVIQPALVRACKVPECPHRHDVDVHHVLVAGERRWRASRLKGRSLDKVGAAPTHLPAVVADLTDETAMQITIAENVEREDLTPVEHAAGVQMLMALHHDDLDVVADRLGKDRSWVARRSRLVRLSQKWRQAALDTDNVIHTWGAVHLEVIARLPSSVQDDLYSSHYRFHIPVNPKVGDLEQMVQRHLQVLRSAPWKLDDDELYPKAGACTTCPKRSGQQPALWDDVPGQGAGKEDRCTDSACWEVKTRRQVTGLTKRLRGSHSGVVLVRTRHYGHGAARPSHVVGSVDQGTVSKTKKADGVPCVVVDGPKAGTYYWGQPTRAVSRDAAGQGGGRAPGAVTPLKERRAALERRRRKLAIHGQDKPGGFIGFVQLLRAHDPPPLDTLLALVAAFGSTEKAEYRNALSHHSFSGEEIKGKTSRVGHVVTGGRRRATMSPEAWARFDLYRDDLRSYREASRPTEHLEADLWDHVRPVLLKRLEYHAHEDMLSMWWEVERTAALLGDDENSIDPGALWADARKAIPTPASWALLNPDGTPKLTLKSTPKKGKKKKAG